MRTYLGLAPAQIIIAIEGVNGVGKTTLFERLKEYVFPRDEGNLYFLDFKGLKDIEPENLQSRADYVEKRVRESLKHDVIVSDRWITSDLIYKTPEQSYISKLSEDIQELLFSPYFFYIRPSDHLDTHNRMMARDHKEAGRPYISLQRYYDLNKDYKKMLETNAPDRFTILKDKDVDKNFTTLSKKIRESLFPLSIKPVTRDRYLVVGLEGRKDTEDMLSALIATGWGVDFMDIEKNREFFPKLKYREPPYVFKNITLDIKKDLRRLDRV